MFALALALAVSGACAKGDDKAASKSKEKKDAASSTSATDDATAPAGSAEADKKEAADGSVGGGPATTLAGPLGNIKAQEPIPSGKVTVKLSRTITGTASGEPEVRCVTGSGFFDVVLSFEAAPQSLNPTMGLVSLSFGAPSFKGPGGYKVAAEQASYSVLIENSETKEGTEFFAPDRGLAGSVEIAADAKSGTFDLRGLVDADARPLDVNGNFSCGQVEKM